MPRTVPPPQVFWLTALTLLTGTAHAGVSYLDADVDPAVGSPNTVSTDGLPPAMFYEPNGSAGTIPGMWARRTEPGIGNNQDILQAQTASNPNDIPGLTTTITGLTAGETYHIYAFFWDAAGNQAWSLDAGLAADSLTTFQGPDDGTEPIADTTSGLASDLTLTSTLLLTAGNRALHYGDLGNAVANASGEIQVFVDNSTSTRDNPFRSWYDGVGYERVPDIPHPEPE